MRIGRCLKIMRKERKYFVNFVFFCNFQIVLPFFDYFDAFVLFKRCSRINEDSVFQLVNVGNCVGWKSRKINLVCHETFLIQEEPSDYF